ncbi:MAG: hypothetical protein LBK25_02735 [Treponema sp.]|nr:hypothetical protein [Treponema sp.]
MSTYLLNCLADKQRGANTAIPFAALMSRRQGTAVSDTEGQAWAISPSPSLRTSRLLDNGVRRRLY